MKIEYTVKNVYGVDRNYIKDESLAKAVQSLTGQKTITQEQFKALEALGLELVQVI